MSSKANRMMKGLIAAVSIAAMTGTAWAEAIVVRSTGAAARQYPPRTRLADNAVVRLTGGSVTILTTNGTRTFRERGAYRLDAARQGAGSILAAASNSSGVSRSGVSRTLDGSVTGLAPNRAVWQADITIGGAVCFVPGNAVTLWRPAENVAASTATITRVSDNASAIVTWAAGQDVQSWPADMPLAAESYRISWNGAAQPTEISFTALSADPANQIELVSALLETGCETQADILAARAEPAATAAPSRS